MSKQHKVNLCKTGDISVVQDRILRVWYFKYGANKEFLNELKDDQMNTRQRQCQPKNEGEQGSHFVYEVG